MKKIFLIIVLVAFSISLIVNCGGNDNNSNNKNKEVKRVANFVNGEKVYNKVCIACHLTGVAGAAPLNNKERWEENAALGIDKLVQIAINGNPKGKYGVMPPRGTCADCTDDDLFDAVSYMLRTAGVTAK